MKRYSFYKYFAPTALVVGLVASGLFFTATTGANSSNGSAFTPPVQSDPSTSLARGRVLLKQGHADQALGLLESALKDYTQANNARGIAASINARFAALRTDSRAKPAA